MGYSLFKVAFFSQKFVAKKIKDLKNGKKKKICISESRCIKRFSLLDRVFPIHVRFTVGKSAMSL